mmetsp:Transcript_15866/g.43093  ORF Transcript_15866/g.43093 Transcript_15866/m.43093 type:complete len:230 (+) Transcript_15866:254-943(+)
MHESLKCAIVHQAKSNPHLLGALMGRRTPAAACCFARPNPFTPPMMPFTPLAGCAPEMFRLYALRGAPPAAPAGGLRCCAGAPAPRPSRMCCIPGGGATAAAEPGRGKFCGWPPREGGGCCCWYADDGRAGGLAAPAGGGTAPAEGVGGGRRAAFAAPTAAPDHGGDWYALLGPGAGPGLLTGRAPAPAATDGGAGCFAASPATAGCLPPIPPGAAAAALPPAPAGLAA